MRKTLSKARTTTVVALSVLCGGQLAAGTAHAGGSGERGDTSSGVSVLTIDNSGADSWLEVDRTLNVLAPLSKGTAGSDHDGGGGAIDQIVSGSPGVGLQAAPREQDDDAEEADEEQGKPTTCEGDDPEGDADDDSSPARRSGHDCGGSPGDSESAKAHP